MTVAWLPTLAQAAGGQCPFNFADSSDDRGASRLGGADDSDSQDKKKPGRRSDYVEALAAQLSTPTTAQIINRSETQVAPGSRAFMRREQMGQAGAQAAQAQQDFKQALQQARQTQPQPESAVSKSPPTENDAKSLQPTATDPAKPEPAKPTADAPKLSQGKTAPSSSIASKSTPVQPAPASASPTDSNQTNAPGAAPPTATAPSPNANAARQIAQPTVTAAVSAVSAGPTSGAPSNQSASTGGTTSSSVSSIAATGKSSNEPGPTVAKPQASAPAEPSDERASNIERIVQLVRSRQVSDKTSATLRLDPPNLGTLKLHMDLDHQKLALRMEPETAAAHQMLSQHLDALRSSLEAAGIQLVQVQIVPPAMPTDGRDAQAFLNANARGRHGGGEDEKRTRRSAGGVPAIEGASGPPATADAPLSAAEPRVNLVA